MRSRSLSVLFLATLVAAGTLGSPPTAHAASLTVCASGCAFTDLQQALDAAQPGDIILLRAGETFVGNFVLPVKANATGSYIVIRSDAPASALPPAGTRLVPPGRAGANVSASVLARLRGAGGHYRTTPVLRAAAGAHHYRLQFLDIDGVAQEGFETLVSLGTNGSAQTTLSAVPYAIVLDRVFIHGHATKGQKRCVALNGRDLEVLNSYVSGCASFVADSQAISGFNGPGPLRIVNNYLEASAENVMFGGADPSIASLVPSDIEIRRNHISKPLRWRDPVLNAPSAPSASGVAGGGSLGAGTHYFRVVAVMDAQGSTAVSPRSPERAVSVVSGAGVKLSWSSVAGADRYRIYRGTQSGGQNRYLETTSAVTSFTYTGTSEKSGSPPAVPTRWIIKNLLELKNAQRVTIDGNILEHSWTGSQIGSAIVLTPRNQDGGASWTAVRDITITNNIIRHIGNGFVILGRDYIHPSQQTARVSIRNNLVYDIATEWGANPRFMKITQSPADVVIDHNTIFQGATIVLIEDGASTGFRFTNNLAPHRAYGIFGRDAGTGIDAMKSYFPDGVVTRNALGGGDAAKYPTGNFFPDMPTFLAHFVNPTANDYRLVSSSSFRGAGSDATDLGVDFTALNAAQTGGSAPPPPTSSGPYGGTPVSLPGLIQGENFDEGGPSVAYHDTTAGNAGGRYRATDVDIEATGDSGGGHDVGWMAPGEWLKYTVNVGTAGIYDLEFRVASSGGGGTFSLEVEGSNKTGSISIPNTGGWQNWTTVRKTGVSLSSGRQGWRFVVGAAGASGNTLNLNSIRVVSGSGDPTPSPSGGDIVLYASDVTRMAGNWARVSSSSGAGRQIMQSTDRGWSAVDAPRAAPADYFEMSFTPEANRAYQLWIRLRGQADSKWNESVWVQFSGALDGSSRQKWPIGSTSALLVNLEGCAGCGLSGWGWQNKAYWLSADATVRFASASTQTIRIQTREDGVQVDQVVLSPVTYFDRAPGGLKNDSTIVPKNDGGGSEPPPSSGGDIVLYPADVARIAGNWTRMSSSSGAGGQKMRSADGGWSTPDAPKASPADYFEATFTPEANRAYRVWLRLRAANNSKWNDAVWVQFSGAVTSSGSALWRIGTTNGLAVNLEDCSNCGVAGWGWQDNAWWLGHSAVVRFTSTTPQTIRIQTREDGVDVDQIVLSPVTYFDRPPGAGKQDSKIVPK